MSEKKKPTQASFVKSLTIDELLERQNQRRADSATLPNVALAQAPKAVSGVADRLKARAAEAGQNVKEFVAQEQALLRQHAIDMDESEFCLEPEEIALLIENKDELPAERLQHLQACALCQSVVEAAKSAPADAGIGQTLATAASQEVPSAVESLSIFAIAAQI